MTTKKENELTVAAVAISGVRFLTPLLIGVLVWIATQASGTLDSLVEEVRQIQISMAAKQAQDTEVVRQISDHETRIRILERR